jgi:hypothetical protein
MVDWSEFTSYFIHPTKKAPGLESAEQFVIPAAVSPGGKVKIAGLLVGGALAGFGLSSLVGGGKKDEQKQDQEQKQEQKTDVPIVSTYRIEPLGIYAPQLQYSPGYVYSYQGGDIFIESPGASSKKEAAISQDISPSQEGAWSLPYQIAPYVAPSQEQEQQQEQGIGTDFVTLALIGAVALVAYGLVSKGKRK